MSTGSIKDMEKINSQQLETLKRRQYREVKAIENGHQNYKAELKKSHEAEVLDLQDDNQRALTQEAQKKEKVLAEMKHHLQNTQELTDKQLKMLKESSTKESAAIREKSGADQERTVAEGQLYLEELNHKFQSEIQKINQDGKKQTHDMTSIMNESYANQQGQLQKKINDQSMEFTARFNREGMEHKKLQNEVELQNKKLRMSTNQRQQMEMAKLTESHNKFIEGQDLQFRQGLKEQDAFFEKRYAETHAAHSKDANSLDERFHELMNKLKNDVSKEVTKTSDRSDDPFYQLSELRPTWKRTEEGVEIQVAVPEYSKQDLQLTTNNKEVVLNFNRRYSDSNKVNGVSNKVNKVETFTARIDTDIILNPKTVTSSYVDGVMTYNIKKS